jgi:hypothetical protein
MTGDQLSVDTGPVNDGDTVAVAFTIMNIGDTGKAAHHQAEASRDLRHRDETLFERLSLTSVTKEVR